MNKSTKERPMLPEATHGFYTQIGKPVSVHFIDGKSLRGTLNLIGRYEIFLNVVNKEGNEQEITIFKGAIKYIV